MIKTSDNGVQEITDKTHTQSDSDSLAPSLFCRERERRIRGIMEFKTRFYIVAVSLVLLSNLLIEEVESRRVILTGRKVITRTYYKKPLIPAWATVTLVGIFLLVLGGGIYFLLNKIILGDLIRGPKFAKVAKSEAEV